MRGLRWVRGQRVVRHLSSPSWSQEGGNEPSCRATGAKLNLIRPIPPRVAGGLFPAAYGQDEHSRTDVSFTGPDCRRPGTRYGPRSGPSAARPLVFAPYLKNKIKSFASNQRVTNRNKPPQTFTDGVSTRWTRYDEEKPKKHP